MTIKNNYKTKSLSYIDIINIIEEVKPYDYSVKLDHEDMIGCIEGSLASVLNMLSEKYNDGGIAWLSLNGEWSINIKQEVDENESYSDEYK